MFHIEGQKAERPSAGLFCAPPPHTSVHVTACDPSSAPPPSHSLVATLAPPCNAPPNVRPVPPDRGRGSPSDAPPKPQFQCNLKKNFLWHLRRKSSHRLTLPHADAEVVGSHPTRMRHPSPTVGHPPRCTCACGVLLNNSASPLLGGGLTSPPPLPPQIRVSSWEKMEFHKRNVDLGHFYYTNFWTVGLQDPPPPPPFRRTLRACRQGGL